MFLASSQNLILTAPPFGDSVSLRCVNPTLNVHQDATSSFLKLGHLADDGNVLAIRAMPNYEWGRALSIT
jgi:hypothetical protein